MSNDANITGHRTRTLSAGVAFAGMLALLAGCGSAHTEPAPSTASNATFEAQEGIGFTITESSQAAGEDMRFNYHDAVRLLEQGHHSEGTVLLKQVAESAPELSAPQIDLGIAFHQAGELESAESHLTQAIEINPDNPVAHNELGIVYRKLGRFQDARQSYERALAIYPGYHYARRNLAVLCDLYLADFECAMENYEAYMDSVESDEEASMWIADLRARME